MPFIGRQPVIGNFQKCDSISVVNGQAAYTLQVGGVNVSPQSENHMLVSLNGILQAPVDSFTVSGSTLTFASNLVTGDVIDFVMILGNVLDLGVPSDNTVTTAKLADSSVTTAKLNDASVSLAKLTATGTKDATTFLRGDNTFAEPGGGDFVKLASSDATSVSSIEFQDIFTTDYRHYRIIGADTNPNNDQLVFQFLSSGSTAVTTGYYGGANELYITSGGSTGSSIKRRWDGDDISVSFQNNSGLGESTFFDITLTNPTDSASYKTGVILSGQFAANGQFYASHQSFLQAGSSSSYSGIKFQGNGSQTINHAKITIYGVK